MAAKAKENEKETGCIKVSARLQLRIKRQIMLSRVPVTLIGPDNVPREEYTDAEGEFCFEGLTVNETYTVVFPIDIDEDDDGFPEFRLHEQAIEGVAQSEPGQYVIEVIKTGNCADDSCASVDVLYRLLPESLALDAVDDLRGIRQAVDDLANATRPTAGVPAASVSVGVPGGTGVQTFVETAVSRVFGTTIPTRLELKDAAIIREALDKQIIRVDLPDSRVEYVWNPDTDVTTTRANGDQILTGNQARLYRRANSCLKDTMAILEQLEPLCPEADLDAVNAQKGIIRDLINALVTEFGQNRGPSKFVVESLMTSLQDELEALEAELCYEQEPIDNLEDEKQRTSGLLLRDTVEALKLAWANYQAGDPRLAFGTQIRRLKDTLTALDESVQGAHNVLTGEGFGLDVIIDEDSMTVGDLLASVEQFAKGENQKLNHESNRRRVNTIRTLAQHLHALVTQASQSSTPPFDQRYVRTAFARIAQALKGVITRATKIVDAEPTDEADKDVV